MAVNDFDFIAPVYDRLGKFIFNDQILKSQTHFLDQIKPVDQVLIVGGGTGEFLEDFPVCRGIDFIEKSDKMTQKARNRNSTASIQFINRDFLQVSLTEVYGVIICPFFLDCFKEQNLELVISKLREHSKKGGILIVTEFQKPTSFIVRLMHVFFRIASRLESKKLKNIDQFVQNEGFTMEQEKFFHRNMIFSRVYRNL